MKLIVEGNMIIEKQLSINSETEIEFADGSKTLLKPAKFIPCPANKEMKLSLNGKWKVKKWPFPVSEEELCKSEVDDTNWEIFEQPGKIFYSDPEEHYEEVENWNRVTLDHIDENDGAVLRKEILIPEKWEGKRVYLRIDGIYPAAKIFCNGKLLDEHYSGLTPCTVDLTESVSAGAKAAITLRLLRKHKYVQMDMPRHALEFAGINRNIYLFAVDNTFLSDSHIISSLNDTLDIGYVNAKLKLTNCSDSDTPCAIYLSLKRQNSGKVICVSGKNVICEPNTEQTVELNCGINNPLLWNDEYPNLYNATVKLEFERSPAVEYTYNIGFRRFELKNKRAYLNGNPVKFRGVNHLTYHPDYGMYTPKEWLYKCLSLMKKANVNAIRTHFFSPPELVDICDELGIYLLQELPIDWGTHYIHLPEWVGPALMRLEGSVRRDRHHPSLMVWSIGNENMPETTEAAPQGWNHLRIYNKFVKTLDNTRYTMFPPPGPANKIKGIFELRLGDIADIHYSFSILKEFKKTGKTELPVSWEGDMEVITEEQAIKNGWSGVWFSSEYGIFNFQPDLLNAPYLSVIADTPKNILSGENTLQVFTERLREEWGYMLEDDSCLGGAYFPWLCSGTGVNNPWSWVKWGEDADWGVVTADLLPKPAFWALRVLFSPVHFPPILIWKKGITELKFKIKNYFNRIDLNECTLRTMQAGGGKWMGQMRCWKDIPVSCPPGEQTEITIPIWNNQTINALNENMPVVCRCILLKPDGFKVITHDIVIIPEDNVELKECPIPIGPDAIL